MFFFYRSRKKAFPIYDHDEMISANYHSKEDLKTLKKLSRKKKTLKFSLAVEMYVKLILYSLPNIILIYFSGNSSHRFSCAFNVRRGNLWIANYSEIWIRSMRKPSPNSAKCRFGVHLDSAFFRRRTGIEHSDCWAKTKDWVSWINFYSNHINTFNNSIFLQYKETWTRKLVVQNARSIFSHPML